ncbi:MAG TPA: hypothetical protein VI583_09740 [Cyclobacteriaceae bacterium]|nr:hypothetical protein [Cyclobacteriaceae bacterium]
MKKTNWIITTILVAALSVSAVAQSPNWASITPDQKHIANLNFGWDYSLSLGLGYGYKIGTKIPILINGQFSIPAGENLDDDFKAKLGGQVRLVKAGNFMATAIAYGIYRRYETEIVKFQNFGSEFTGVAGFYKPHWYAAGEFGFDKAVVTHINNSEVRRQFNPSAADGWFIPMGGNFHYGIQTGCSVKFMDAYIKIGKTVDQYLKPTAVIPYYFQFGTNMRF